MWFKSLFISLYVVISLIFVGLAIYLASDVEIYITLFSLMAALPFLLFLTKLYLVKTPRTKRFLPLLILFPFISFIIFSACITVSTTHWHHILIALTALLGNSIYLLWYSKMPTRPPDRIRMGKPLPDFELLTLLGETFHSRKMREQPSLILFYRGNWCAICTAQVKEVAAQYRELQQRGINIYMVSPQPSIRSAKLSQKFNAPMLFLADPNNTAAKQLQIDIDGGLPFGLQTLGYQSNSVIPTVIMTDQNGMVFFADITDNYRVRPLPSDFIRAFDLHKKATS